MHTHAPEDSSDVLRPESLRPKGSRVDVAATELRTAQSRVGNPEQWLGLQRAAGNSAVAGLMEEERSPVHDVISSGGRPLEPEVRGDMERRLGADFSDVRIHDNSAAAASASAVNAHAYTVGSNVVFQRDTYDPFSHGGQVTLAHELTHVIQQRSGPVDGTSAPGGIQVSDPSDRFEREASDNAERVMSTPAAALQREEGDEEEL